MNKKVYILRALFKILITGSILIDLSGRAVCIRDTQNYDELQPELSAPDVIHSVLYDEALKQLYVCYNDASYVNVYTETGEFLWAVSTPYLRNAYFELRDGKLIIYSEDAYIYDSSDGEFIKRVSAGELELEYSFEASSTDEFSEGEFYFDSYQVYRANSAGELETVVSRPWWYWFFNLGVCVSAAFLGLIGYFLSFLPEKIGAFRKLKGFKPANSRQSFIFNYFRITSAVHIVYAIINIISAIPGGVLPIGVFCIGILPLGLHFIISGSILLNKLDSVSASKEERAALELWKSIELVTFIGAFFSVAVVACITG